jgi:hypothetical protein
VGTRPCSSLEAKPTLRRNVLSPSSMFKSQQPAGWDFLHVLVFDPEDGSNMFL